MCITGNGIPDTSYLSSPDFIAFSLHCVTFIELPVMSFGAYCILFKTPPRMKSVKLLMLNLHFWSSVSDFLISFIGIPYILLPAPAGYGLGLLNSPRLLLYFMITLLAALAASVLAIYENRYFSLFGRNTWWKNYRKPFFIFIIAYLPIIFIPPIFNIPEQSSARELILNQIPCLPPFTYNNRELFVLALDYTVSVYSVLMGTLVLAVSITTFGVLMGINMVKVRINPAYSSRTYKIQRTFAVALIIQSIFLLVVSLCPVVIALFVIVRWYHNQALNNFIFITLAFHGIGSTIVMILVHKPYRQFTISLFQKRSSEENNQKSGTVSVVLNNNKKIHQP